MNFSVLHLLVEETALCVHVSMLFLFAGHVPTIPWVRSRVWIRVRLGSGIASERGG